MSINTPIVELLTPKIDLSEGDSVLGLERKLVVFKEVYQELIVRKHTVSIPDNPMGVPRFTAMETIDYLGLQVPSDKLLCHINTFHTRHEIEELLNMAADNNVTNILCVSGDGSGKRHRLEPVELGINSMTVTSIDLLNFIHREYPSRFNLGVAFNQWATLQEEIQKLMRKVDAGAQFIITQPFLKQDTTVVGKLLTFGLPLFLGIWFSKNLNLLSSCVDSKIKISSYDPFEALEQILFSHKECGLYVSLLNKQNIGRFSELLPYETIGTGTSYNEHFM